MIKGAAIKKIENDWQKTKASVNKIRNKMRQVTDCGCVAWNDAACGTLAVGQFHDHTDRSALLPTDFLFIYKFFF